MEIINKLHFYSFNPAKEVDEKDFRSKDHYHYHIKNFILRIMEEELKRIFFTEIQMMNLRHLL